MTVTVPQGTHWPRLHEVVTVGQKVKRHDGTIWTVADVDANHQSVGLIRQRDGYGLRLSFVTLDIDYRLVTEAVA